MGVPIVYAFGPDGSYFIQSPSMTRWEGIPERIEKDLQNRTIAFVYHRCLGANGSYLVTYRNNKGGNSFYDHGLPPGLTKWLNTSDKKGYSVFNIPKLRLSLGPDNNSSFCHDEHNYRSFGLPDGLQKALDKLKNTKGQYVNPPRVVALGPDDRYVMVNSRHGRSWRAKNVNEGLDSLLRSLENFKFVQDGVFNMNNPTNYVVFESNGVRSLTRWSIRADLGEVMKEVDAEIESASSAAEMTRANQQANSDFIVRQMLQAQQFQQQSMLTTLQNIQTINGAAMFNSAIF